MNGYLLFVYVSCFAVIAGASFAMMWGNLKSITQMMDAPPKPRHPEAPAPGDEVMYVDVSGLNSEDFNQTKQSLEDLYNE